MSVHGYRAALSRLWQVLRPEQRRRFAMLQVVSLFMAVSTLAGLAAVMSFLVLLSDPSLVEKYSVLAALRRLAGATPRELLGILAGVFSLLLVASALLNVYGLRAIGRFAYSVGDRVREVLFMEYLRRDYLFHAANGAGRLMDNVLNQADRVTVTLLNGQLLITNTVLMLLLLASIAWVNPWVAAGGAVVIAGSYLLFYRVIWQRIAGNGRRQVHASGERVAVVEQALRGIKYLLLTRAQPAFTQRFTDANRALSRTVSDTQFIGQFPRHLLEFAAGIALISCAAWFSATLPGGVWLAQLSFIGFAGFRLLPVFQQMYHAFVVVRACRPALEILAGELAEDPAIPVAAVMPAESLAPALRTGVQLEKVSFRYSSAAPSVLDDVSLHIPAGAAVGIVGPSGSGKTTLVDLVLGLLAPSDGRIEVDGVELNAQTAQAWQQRIGYVPQEVVILDASVRENIAFGVDPACIDDARVREAAKQAGASGFIESLAGGYAARIGAAGASLSGGQRQRIGIARALYVRPALLVLDEATNSLDADTEQAIVSSVIGNRGSRTLLVAAHGAAVIAACDVVYEVRGGKLRERFARTEPGVARTRRVAE